MTWPPKVDPVGAFTADVWTFCPVEDCSARWPGLLIMMSANRIRLQEQAIRDHLETHDVIEWAETVQHLREALAAQIGKAEEPTRSKMSEQDNIPTIQDGAEHVTGAEVPTADAVPYGDKPEVEVSDTEVVHGADGPPSDEIKDMLGIPPEIDTDGVSGLTSRTLAAVDGPHPDEPWQDHIQVAGGNVTVTGNTVGHGGASNMTFQGGPHAVPDFTAQGVTFKGNRGETPPTHPGVSIRENGAVLKNVNVGAATDSLSQGISVERASYPYGTAAAMTGGPDLPAATVSAYDPKSEDSVEIVVRQGASQLIVRHEFPAGEQDLLAVTRNLQHLVEPYIEEERI